MDAVQRRGSAARMNYIKRFVSVLLCLVVCAGLMPPPRAQAAFVIDDAVLLAGIVLSSCGLKWVISDMTGEGFQDTVRDLLNEFTSENGFASISAWLGNAFVLSMSQGKLVIPRGLTNKYVGFADWVFQKYNIADGLTASVMEGVPTAKLTNGMEVNFHRFRSSQVGEKVFPSGTVLDFRDYLDQLPYNLLFPCGAGIEIRSYNSDTGLFKGTVLCSDSISASTGIEGYSISHYNYVFLINEDTNKVFCELVYTNSVTGYFVRIPPANSAIASLEELNVNYPSVNLEAVNPAIPDIAGMGEADSMAFDIGTSFSNVEDMLQHILDAILLGNLTVTGEVITSGEVVEPTTAPVPTTAPGEMVGDIAVSDIVTAAQDGELRGMFITKFPFSIPWDLYNAVQLLAAPPQTPHWEVDFLAPVAHRFGGFEGSTKIVIDFSDYEILGQLCRWVSTIMFVSSLAMGTKRLMWTA